MVETKDNNLANAQRALGTPFHVETAPEVAKTRLRLLVAPSAALVFGPAHLHMQPGSALFGILIGNLPDEIAGVLFMVAIVYLLVHFLWCSFGAAHEWRRRLSGANQENRADDALYPYREFAGTLARRRSIAGGYSTRTARAHWSNGRPTTGLCGNS